MNEAEKNGRRKRSLNGLMVNKQFQFKLAVSCSVLILLPALIATVTCFSELGRTAASLAQNGVESDKIAQSISELAFKYGLIVIAMFFGLGAASVLLSMKLSNQLIGPTKLLESQIQGMIDGNYEPRRALREGDYLQHLGDLLNSLAKKLKENPPSK